jgi:hypothetical protein
MLWVSLPLKKTPIQLGVTACCRFVIAVWLRFLNLNLLGRVWQPAADYNGCLADFKCMLEDAHQMAICRGLPYPTRSLNRIVTRWQEDHTGSKATLRPDFQANT